MGIDPSAKRQAEKAARVDTFESVAREFLGREQNVEDDTIAQLRHRLETYVFPHVGRWPIVDVTAPELLKLLRRIESRGTLETAHRVRSIIGRVFRYAIATGRTERDPAADLRGAIASAKTKNFAAITEPRHIGELLRAIDGYQGQPTVMAALRHSPLVFERPGELRGAEWSEFDFQADHPEWRIPAARMKMGEEHVVPLATQAVRILEELRAHAGEGHRLLFPSLLSKERPISDNTLNAALRRLGFAGDEMVAHGFRAMASTRLNEMGFAPEVI